jgi:hypothetical protein
LRVQGPYKVVVTGAPKADVHASYRTGVFSIRPATCWRQTFTAHVGLTALRNPTAGMTGNDKAKERMWMASHRGKNEGRVAGTDDRLPSCQPSPVYNFSFSKLWASALSIASPELGVRNAWLQLNINSPMP